MSRFVKSISSALSLACCLSAIGCGKNDRPELGVVIGTVTLDGEALPEANVAFSPVEGGRTSTAVTDVDGKYELIYTTAAKGAKIGEHHVRISTFQQGGDEPDAPKGVPEMVPAKYQKSGTITEQVSAGPNTIDIDLTSK